MTDSPEDMTPCIVLDNGSHRVKAGFGGDDSPRAVFPTIVGHERSNPQAYPLVGDRAASRLSTLDITCPIEDGVVINWDTMEQIWQYLFTHELRVEPENQPLFITENNVKSTNRQKMAEVVFEGLKVPACSAMSSALPGLVASGMTCGLVVYCGADLTNITPLHDCQVIKEGIRSMNVGGNHVTSFLGQLLHKRGYQSEKWSVDELKRGHCFFADGPDDQRINTVSECSFPNGTIVALGEEKQKAPECLFTPSLIGTDDPGLAHQVYSSIEQCSGTVRKELYASIHLVGSSTMFPGMKDRLARDLKLLLPANTQIKVIACPERRSTVWMGGSILTSIDFGRTMWVTRHQYEESGPDALMVDWEPPPGIADLC